MKHKQRGFWNFALPAIASVAGGLLGKEGQEDTNEANANINSAQMAFNADEARKNREFQAAESLRNRAFQDDARHTQYQVAMDDLEKAGLNPMLAYQNGGAKPTTGAQASGAQATSGGMIPMGNATAAGVNSAISAAQIANVQADTKVKEAQAEKISGAEIPHINASADVLRAQIPKITAEIDKLREERAVLIKEGWNKTDFGNLLRAQEQLAQIEMGLKNNTMELQDAQKRATNALATLNELAKSGAENTSKFEETLEKKAGTGANGLRFILEIAKTLSGAK